MNAAQIIAYLEAGTPSGVSSPSPEVLSNDRPKDEGGPECPITLIQRSWCSHCTGAKLPTDEERIPTIHDGRHGRKCGRCMGRIRAERSAAKLRSY